VIGLLATLGVKSSGLYRRMVEMAGFHILTHPAGCSGSGWSGHGPDQGRRTGESPPATPCSDRGRDSPAAPFASARGLGL